MRGHRTLKAGYKRGISKTGIQRTTDHAAATQPTIDLPTLTLVKGGVVSSEAIHTNLRMIETGSQVVHSVPLIVETMIELAPLLQIDPVRPPLSIVCHHVQISPHMTRGGQRGIGREITTLATTLVTDTTARTTCRQFVMTAPKEIHGDRRMITGRDLLPPLRLDLLELIMFQLLPVPPTKPRTASIPRHRHPQTPLRRPLQNDRYPQSISQYPSPSLQKNRLLPSLVAPRHPSILHRSSKMSQRLSQALPISLPLLHRSVQSVRGALVRKRSWHTVTRSRVVARSTIMKLRPSWERERLGESPASTHNFTLTTLQRGS